LHTAGYSFDEYRKNESYTTEVRRIIRISASRCSWQADALEACAGSPPCNSRNSISDSEYPAAYRRIVVSLSLCYRIDLNARDAAVTVSAFVIDVKMNTWIRYVRDGHTAQTAPMRFNVACTCTTLRNRFFSPD